MLYMLDTDTCSYIIRERPVEVLATMQRKAQSGDDLVVSVIAYAELKLGAERSAHPRKYSNAVAMFSERLDAILPWNKRVADEFATIQSRLLKKGTPIDDNDAMIAAHARQVDAVLVTNNQKHFIRVPQLKLDNWVLAV